MPSPFSFGRRKSPVDSQAEAIGCGISDTSGRVTTIRVRMQVALPAMQVELWEFDPVGDNGLHLWE